MLRSFVIVTCSILCCLKTSQADDPVVVTKAVTAFVQSTCVDCHSNGNAEGGFDLSELTTDLLSPAAFARWEQVYDQAAQGKMPPMDAAQPSKDRREEFLHGLRGSLKLAHQRTRGTVFRRLNRQEFANTLNDVFGTNLELTSLLPEDGKSDEFDNVGASLNVSLVHMQRYMQAAELVLETAIENRLSPPEVKNAEFSYATGRDAANFIGSKWLKLDDGAVVFFQDFGYPSGMLREASNGSQAGFYKIRVTGYAYQSDKPITFSIGGTSYARGSAKPIYGYFSLPPGKPQTVEVEVWMEPRYMVEIKTFGIYDEQYDIKNKGLENYTGPGLAVSKVEIEGPIVHEFPSRGHQLLFAGLPRTEVEPNNPADKNRSNYVPQFEIRVEDELSAVESAIQTVASRLFRRPVAQEELGAYLQLFQSERAAGETIESAYRATIVALICSTGFLYFNEASGRLGDYAIASRLSYFLTRTTPDTQLLELASQGNLAGQPEVLDAEVKRLMQSEHFFRFARDFVYAWLNLRELDFTVPDRKLFPEYDRYLRKSMEEETIAYLDHCLQQNLPISNLVKSEFAMLNERLADHYGIAGVSGSEVRRVKLPEDSVRGGFLSQAAVLKVSANGTNTSPVVRGVYVTERILGIHPSPPPPNVNGVEPDIRGAETLREILAQHRNVASCQSCHKLIDPPGFALESFNPIGGQRDYYRSVGEGEKVLIYVHGRKTQYRIGRDVDSSGRLLNGSEFESYKQFRDHLAADKEVLAQAFVTKLLTFATGRELGFSDREEITRIVQTAKNSDYGMRDLLVAAVTSRIFLEK